MRGQRGVERGEGARRTQPAWPRSRRVPRRRLRERLRRWRRPRSATRGMSYQRWGLGSLPVTSSTAAAFTRRGCPLSAPRSELDPGVVAGAVLDHDLGLGQRGGVGGVRLEEVGVGIGAGDERGDLDIAPADLAGDVAPEVLRCHCVHDAGRAGAGIGGAAARQAEGGRGQGGTGQDRPEWITLTTVTVIILDKPGKGPSGPGDIGPTLSTVLFRVICARPARAGARGFGAVRSTGSERGRSLSRRRAASSRRRAAGGGRRRRPGSRR